MGLTTSGCRNDVSGVVGGGGIRNPPPEYCCPVYCNSSDTVSIYGGGAMDSSAVDTAVVGSVQTQFRERGQEGGGS